MSNKTELVIARYNEDLSWLEKIPKDIKITIYNKGLDDIEYDFIKLQNIGRESHTYLYHIINNYNNLAEQTIFCQGDSIFHSPDFLKLIKYRKYFEPMQPLSAYYWPEGEPPHYFANPPESLLKATKNLHIKNCKIHVEYLDNEFVTKYPHYYYEENFNRYVNKIKELYKVDNVLKFNVDRFHLKNVDLNKLIPVCYAGLFSVNKNVIRENSIKFYENILDILINDVRIGIYDKILDHGLFLEKLWLLIFNYRKNNKNYVDLNVKDYINQDKKIIIVKNQLYIHLKIIVCQIFLNINIDNIIYNIYLSRYRIYLKKNVKIRLYDAKPIGNIKYPKILNNDFNANIYAILKDNRLIIKINNFIVIDYKFNHRVQNMISAKIFSIAEENKFKDLHKKLT